MDTFDHADIPSGDPVCIELPSYFSSDGYKHDVVLRLNKSYIVNTVGEHSFLVYYPIISYQTIEVYSIETMDMGIFCWNNGILLFSLDAVIFNTLVI